MIRVFAVAGAAAGMIALVAGFSVKATAAQVKARQIGVASYYTMGKTTANGEHFNPSGLTAAHRTLRFGTRVRVVNLRNGRSVTVRINDRGPFIKGRIIDLALGAAKRIGLHHSGIARVRLEVIN